MAGAAERQRRYLLVLEDYTDRKQAALQLEAAVAQQRTLLETMTAAVAQVRDGVVLRANGEFARLFGFDEAASIGMRSGATDGGARSGCGLRGERAADHRDRTYDQ